MKNKSLALLLMTGFISISLSMEKEEFFVVEGAAYCSLEFPDQKKMRVFRMQSGSLAQASEESIAELLQEKLCVVVRLKSKDRKTLNKFSTTLNGIADANELKHKIGIMLDPEAEIPTFLSSSEQLVEKHAVIKRGCNPS